MQSTFERLFNLFDETCLDLLNTNLGHTSLDHLTFNHYKYLEAINELNMPTLSQLAEHLNITKPSTTVMVNKLIKEDLVEKVQSSDDKRLQIVKLTPLGIKVITIEKDAFQQVTTKLMEGLTADEKKQLLSLIEKGLSNAK